jgi:hypothetical protein
MRVRILAAVALAAVLAMSWIGYAAAEEAAAPRAAAAATPAAGEAPDSPSKADAPTKAQLHGGKVNTTSDHAFETVFGPDGIRVYVYKADQTPLLVGVVEGTAVVNFADGSRRELALEKKSPADDEEAIYFCPAHPGVVQTGPGTCAADGKELAVQDYLFGKTDLSNAELGVATATVALAGLDGREPSATFVVTSESEKEAPSSSSAVPKGATESEK